MTPVLRYDADVASQSAAAWLGWADRTNRTAHDLEWDLRRWQLDQVGATASSALRDACTALWTAVEYTNLVTATVRAADRVPFAAQGAALLGLAEAIVALRRPGRRRDGQRHARTEWLRDLSDADARAWFDRRYPDDVGAVLAELDDDRVLVYWELLTPSERREVIAGRPDLVAFRVLAHGGRLGRAELGLLHAATAYPVFSETWAAEFELSVGVRVAEIVVGAEARVIATKLSDGSVEMVLLEGASAGVGADLSVPGTASAEGWIGGLAAFQQRFRFADEGEAAAAIHTLIAAARRDASFGELVGDTGRWAYNQWAAHVNAPGDLANAALDLAFGVEPVPTLPALDLTPELARALGRLWETNAVSRTGAVGAHVVADAEVAGELAAFEVELESAATATIAYYETRGAAGHAGEDRTGLLASGSVRSAVAASSGAPGGARVDFAGEFVLDLHEGPRGAELTVTLVGEIGSGPTAELFELPIAELDVHRESTVSTSIELTVPVDRSTGGDVVEIGRWLARGELPVGAMARLYDRAEVSAEVARGRRTTAAKVDVDVGVVEVDAELTSRRSETSIARRKHPNGDPYSPSDIDRLVERGRRDVRSGSPDG